MSQDRQYSQGFIQEEEHNKMAAEDTEGLTLHKLVEQAAKHSTRLAIVFDNGHNCISVTYEQLWNISAKVVQLLSGYVQQHEVVAVCLKTDIFLPAILIGILRLGAAFYNFDQDGFHYALQAVEEVGIKTMLIHKEYLKVLDVKSCIRSARIIAIDDEDLNDYVIIILTDLFGIQHTSRLAYCITTSGTTGTPKVVRVPHACIVPNILHFRQIFSLTSDDLVLGATALTFDPSLVEIFITLSSGACLLLVPPVVKIIPNLFLEVVSVRNKVTVMQLTPSLLCRFKRDVLIRSILGDNSSVRVLALGGESFPVLDWLRQQRSANNKTVFYNLYGTTEVSCWATCYRVTDSDIRQHTGEITIGYPLKDTILQVKDDQGDIITEGVGKLFIGGTERQCITGKAEVLSYDPSRLALRDTGDMVKVDQSGQIYYLGRVDRQVKRNGQRINLDEIKMVVMSSSLVQTCEAFMKVDNQLVVAIVLECSDSSTVVGEVIGGVLQYVKSRLPSHWWPDDAFVLQNMPVTKHGKIDIHALRSMYMDQLLNKPSTHDVNTLLETKWKETLHLSRPVEEVDNFILSGGNSLKAVYLANSLENELHHQLPLLLDVILQKTFKDVKDYVELMFGSEFTDTANVPTNLPNVIATDNCGRYTDLHRSAKAVRKINNTICSDNNCESFSVTSQKKIKLNTSAFKYAITRCNKTYDVHSKCNSITEKQFGESAFQNEMITSARNVDKNVNNFFCDETLIDRGDLKFNQPKTQNLKNTSNPDESQSSVVVCMKTAWQYDTKKCIDASPLIAVAGSTSKKSYVYIGSHSHMFVAIDLETGSADWEITLPDRIEASASLSLCGNYVIVGCYDGCIYTLCADTGCKHWTYDTGSVVKCSPVVDTLTGYVYLGSHSQFFYCLDVSACVLVWKNDLGCGSIFSSPAISNESHCVYVATLGAKLFSLNLADGVILWEYDLFKPVFSSPSVTHLGVCVGCTDGYLYHISHQGTLLWRLKTDGPIFASPSTYLNHKKQSHLTSSKTSLDRTGSTSQLEHYQYGIETTVVGSHDGCLYSIDMATGGLIWKLQTGAQIYSSPFQCTVKVHKTVSMLPDDKASEASSLQSGLLSDSNKSESSYSPSRHDYLDVVVFATTTATVYVVDQHSGSILCEEILNGEIFSSPVVVDDKIVVGCRDDFVYCLYIMPSCKCM